MKDSIKYLCGSITVYLVMAACSGGSHSTYSGSGVSQNGGAFTGSGGVANLQPDAGMDPPAAVSGGGNAEPTGGTPSTIMDPVPNANAQVPLATVIDSGVVEVACIQVGSTTTTITSTSPTDGSVVYSTTSTTTYYQATIPDAAVSLGSVRYAFVEMVGPPVAPATDVCAGYATLANYTCTTQGTVPPASAGTFVPSIGQGTISVSCGGVLDSSTTFTGQAPTTSHADYRWQAARFSYGTAS